MKARFTLLIAMWISLPILAQDPIASITQFSLPENIQLNTDGDFKTFKSSAVEGIGYLISTPPSSQPDKWNAVSDFVSNWLLGTSDISVSLITDIKTEIEGDKFEFAAQYGNLYYAAKAYFLLENLGEASSSEGVIYALNKVLDNYSAMKEAKPEVKSKVLEKYLALRAKGKLEETITKLIGE